MSIAARQLLVSRCVFTYEANQDDLLDPNRTRTELVALLLDASRHYPLHITMVRTGHHDDGPHGHAGGLCADYWPLTPGAPPSLSEVSQRWLVADSVSFGVALADLHGSPFWRQTGLAGTAVTVDNMRIAEALVDSGGDHVHAGAIY